MLSREDFIQSLEVEVRILKHLYTKVAKADRNYRPSPAQRSLQELLDYIPSTVAVTPYLISGDWKNSGDYFGKIRSDAAKDFIGTLEREVRSFSEQVRKFSDADLKKEVTLPTGAKVPLAMGLLNFNLKFLTAYRMQLFLYLKAGQPELGTMNCWMGADPQPK